MRALSEGDLLDAAEACSGVHPIDAAVLLATWADPDLDTDAAASLPLGRRDRLLLDMRAATFGHRFDLSAACPVCQEKLDISLSSDNLLVEEPDGDVAAGLASIVSEGEYFQLRPVNSRDLAAVADLRDAGEARRTLARRCLRPIESDGAEPLSEQLLETTATRLSELDPQADLFADLACPRCGHGWTAPIDIGLLLVREIEVAAERLMTEIHDLARAYHWSEASILALPPSRRAAYLRLVRS
jgi:hypothetical protein